MVDIVQCQDCDTQYEGAPVKSTRKCPACGSQSWTDVRTITGREPCPHCGHAYYWSTFSACPECSVRRDAPKGTFASGTRQAQERAAAAYASLPTDERMEFLLQQILDEQRNVSSRISGIRWGLVILFAWLVVIPFLIALFVSR